MIVNVVQRWRDRRASYRPAGEPIATRLHEVAAIADDVTAKRFVIGHHYSASFPAARFRFGLYRGASLVGVAVFSQPVREEVFSGLPGHGLERVELGRLVLLDEVQANAESWFVARAFELLRREGLVSVVSFSDPVPRSNAAGDIIFLGHAGTVYQALNATFIRRTRPETRRLLPDGTVLHNRALAKVRKLDRGWHHVVAHLEQHGARPLVGDPIAWLGRELPRITRPLWHGGNLKYAWALDRRARRFMPASKPYPKLDLIQAEDPRRAA